MNAGWQYLKMILNEYYKAEKQKIRDKLYFICSYLSAFSSVHNKICKTNNHDYGVSTNLYSLNENGEIVREKKQQGFIAKNYGIFFFIIG